jgi:hypothetical protein
MKNNTRWVNNEQMFTLAIRSIIFSRNFAKAFWEDCDCSDQQVLSYEDPTRRLKHWQYHLQEMVIEKNPLSYIAQFL